MIRILLLSFVIIGCSTTQPKGKACEKTRGAFDIGSAETRLNVARVNICENKIIAEVFQVREKIAFKENTKDKKLSDEIQGQGLVILKEMKQKASAHKVDEYVAVATSGLRGTSNGQAYADKINRELDINLQIITQAQEAEVGYYAALAVAPITIDRFVVWDIGGGSQQIVFMNENDRFEIYRGQLASIGFKDRVLAEIVKRKGPSPNPLNEEQMQAALKLASTHALQDVPEKMRKVIADKNTRVICIGSVHYHSVLKQIPDSNSNRIELKQVVDLTKLYTGKSDTHFPGQKYVETTITNVALVAGMMQALKIPAIEIYDANLTNGLLLHPTFW